MILNTCMDHSVTYKKIEESASQFPKYSRKKVHHYLVATPVEIIIRYRYSVATLLLYNYIGKYRT